MAAKVDPTKTWLSVSPSKRSSLIRFNRAYASRASCRIRFRRRYTSAIIVANASANIASAIVANADATANGAMVADRLHNQATPWLMLPTEVDEISGEKLECFYSLADGQTVRLNRNKSLKVPDTAKCVASTKGSWLAYVDSKEGSFYLSSPFLNEVVELPSLEHLPSVVGVERDPNTGSILQFKVKLPDYEWYTWDDTELDPYDLTKPESMTHMVSHLALSQDHPRDPDCVAMAMQGEMSRLAYCCIGKQFHPQYHHPSETCCINNGPIWYGLQEDYFPGPCIHQVAYCSKKELFYALFDSDIIGGILAFDVERNRGRRSKKVFQFRMFELEAQLKHHFFQVNDGESECLKETRRRCASNYYLVTLANGDLLLIVRHYTKYDDGPPYKTLHLDVFRVAYPGTLERVRSLEDRAIFIGPNQSFCIKAGNSPGIRPNSIYFTDDINFEDYGHDIGIFCMEDGVISHVCHPYQNQNQNEEQEVAITMPLFWVAPVSCGLLAFDKEGSLPYVFCHEG